MAEALDEGALEVSQIDSLIDSQYKPKSSAARETIQKSISTLARQALKEGEVDPADPTATIKFIIKSLDDKLSAQVNQIIHHDDFQRLEGSWRGLQYMVANTETDEQLKIRVLNISKKEIGKVLKKYKGTAWEQSPLFKKMYEEEYGTPGGEPFGCIVGDYEFDHSAPDVEILQGLSQVAAAAHTPFIAAASPKLMNMDSWQELANPSDINKLFTSPEYAPWRSLRESEDARYLGLTLPRFLSRLPYGAQTNPVDDFDFEEVVNNDQSNFTWANAAYAMGANITRSFKLYGWCSQIRGVESGGSVEGLPCYTFPTDDGGVDMTCPTEIAITDRREAELAKCGLMPLSYFKNTDYAVFIGAQSLQKPQEYDDPDATANANLSARLPYLFSTCRFAHYLKCIVRDKVGSFAERSDMETWLNNWIRQYVEPDPANASNEAKARRPLAAAEVVVTDVEGNPGYYSAVFYLRPHYQLEGLSASLRLVSKLPTEKG
jgi:type VI secretion system protein ImpC